MDTIKEKAATIRKHGWRKGGMRLPRLTPYQLWAMGNVLDFAISEMQRETAHLDYRKPWPQPKGRVF